LLQPSFILNYSLFILNYSFFIPFILSKKGYGTPSMTLLDFLFPKRSLQGSEGAWITVDEQMRLRSTSKIFTSSVLRERGLTHVDQIFAMSTYQQCPFLKEAIRRFKYRRIPGVGEVLCKHLADAVSEKMELESNACFCPVPLHWSREFQRGFNQAQILSSSLSLRLDIGIQPLLKRVRPTGHQAHRGRQDRLRALQRAFRVRQMAHPHTVYLVDDVFTTGATLEECAKTLKEAGVQRVEGIVLAYD
jgi:ComF family protein